MVDLIFEPVKSLWSNMADLADRIDDLICSFEGGGDTTMDTVAMLIFIWLVCALLVLAVGKYVYARYFAKLDTSIVISSVDDVKTIDGTVESNGVTEITDGSTDAVKIKTVSSARAGGKFIPPTPPLRKRISTKKGSGPTPAGPRTYALVNPPTSTGADPEAVKFVNELFLWLYNDLVIVHELLNVWVQTINELTKKSVAEHGVGVEVVRILPETNSPSLSNVFCECASNDDITITCDCEATPALQLKAFRQRGEKVEVSHYRMNVNRFRARLNIFLVSEKLLADIKCDGWPEIKVALAPVGALKNNLDEQSLQDVISDIVVTGLRNVVVNLNLSGYPTCPRFNRYIPPPAHILPVHYDSLASEMSRHILQPPPPDQKIGDKRLLVKIIAARNLGGGKQKCNDPYCVIEMDDPPQKNQTSVKKETNNPQWDEHFLFDLSSSTGELLFEVYDRSNRGFLGLGIVGVEELLVNPSQRQTISLQPRPYETDEVTGTITVEFMFIEGADVPSAAGSKPFKLKETLRSVTPSGNVITTKTVFAADKGHYRNGGDVVTDSALKELELKNKLNTSPQTNKSTLIIHSVQRVQQGKNGTWEEVPNGKEQGILDSPGNQDSEDQAQLSASDNEGRGRSRKKRRDFFGTIKRRLGRSRTRSKSVDPGEKYANGDDPLARSISADRMRDTSAHSTVPSLKITDGELSRRSSLSELSGLSGASARTYINEASTLVLETVENGIKKHYLIPLSLAQKSKWRKKGTKLHIFNDHTFIAKHLQANTTCQICATLIPRRFGKQGYECRDCLIKSHKACHVKIDHTCPQSTIQNIELCKWKSPILDKKGLPPISPRSTDSKKSKTS